MFGYRGEMVTSNSPVVKLLLQPICLLCEPRVYGYSGRHLCSIIFDNFCIYCLHLWDKIWQSFLVFNPDYNGTCCRHLWGWIHEAGYFYIYIVYLWKGCCINPYLWKACCTNPYLLKKLEKTLTGMIAVDVKSLTFVAGSHLFLVCSNVYYFQCFTV